MFNARVTLMFHVRMVTFSILITIFSITYVLMSSQGGRRGEHSLLGLRGPPRGQNSPLGRTAVEIRWSYIQQRQKRCSRDRELALRQRTFCLENLDQIWNYNASAVKIYNPSSCLVRFEKKIYYILEKTL
jgi:hypothetical protein